MRLQLINPNTTASMTAKAADAARQVSAAGTEVLAGQPSMGPASIEGYYDAALAVPGLLDEIRQAPDDIDAFIVACFDDTGLDAARCATPRPVVGIGEAAFHVASLVAHRFAVVTTLSRSVAGIEANLVRYGLASRCCRVRASDVPVLALEDPASDACEVIGREIEQAIRVDRADAIVLGCAGMTDLAAAYQARFGLPVIDGVAAAVKLAEALVGLGLSTSTLGPYAPPRAKPYTGLLSGFAGSD